MSITTRALIITLLGIICAGIEAEVCNILEYGAVGDGIFKNTKAITNAIAACTRDPLFEYNDDNKNTVLVPSPGTFLTGSFIMTSGIDLYVESGAMLLGSTEEVDYPLIDILPSYGTGRDIDSDLRYQPLIFGQNLSYVSVSGDGIIDGNGGEWYQRKFKKQLLWTRPRMIEFMYSAHILVQDLTLQNSAFWTVHPYASSEIVVQRVRILAPGYGANTDGVDPDSCSNVVIQDCYFSLGDDGIAIKSGLNEYGRAFGMPSENIYIRNITIDPQFDNLSTNGISIGSEMSGGIRNVTIEDVWINGCEAGIYIKSDEGRGGVVEDISYNNIYANRTLQAIKFVMHYSYRRRLAKKRRLLRQEVPQGSNDDDFDETIPIFRRFSVSNYVAENCAQAGVLTGLEGSVMEDMRFTNISIGSALGFFCNQTSGSYENVSPSMENCFDL